MRSHRFAVMLIVLGLVLYAIPAWAGSLPITLFNTGVDDNGQPLQDFAQDPHYTITLSTDPALPGPYPYSTYSFTSGYPFPNWLSNTPISQWITPHQGYAVDWPWATYTYQTTFYLPASFNPATDFASITGLWSADNVGVDILINGVGTGNTVPFGNPVHGGYSYQWLNPLSITSGFLPGWNTLDFIVLNDGDITGLHVQMTGTYNLNTVPETGSTLLFLSIGIIGVLALSWKYGKG
jgi:hypothetical protein